MTFMNYVGAISFIVAIYLCVYALINRVCKCIEHCATAKAYGKFRELGIMVKMEDVQKKIEKDTEEKHYDTEQKA